MSKFKKLLLSILLFPIMPVFAAELTGNVVASSGTPELIKTHYDKTALRAEEPYQILEQFAVKSRNIPRNTGESVEWWKTLPLDVTVAELTYEGTSPSADTLHFQKVTATVGTHGKVLAISEYLGMVAIDPEISSKAKTLGIHRGMYIDRMYWECLAKNLYPMRVTTDSAYEVADIVETSGTNATNAVFASSAGITNGTVGVLVMTGGKDKGMGGYATYASSGTLFTISATRPSYILNEAPVITDTFKFASSTGLTSSYPLTCAALAKTIPILRSNHALPFGDGSFVGVLSPFTEYDVRNDSNWINADQYAGSKKLFNGEIGSWAGLRFVSNSVPWRSTAGTMGTYVASGAVFHTPVFGQECYAGVRIQGVQDQLIIHDKTQVADALELYSTIGWKARLAVKVLNACWGVQVLSGATSIS
jgi:N4-gp56 family major capsid protein